MDFAELVRAELKRQGLSQHDLVRRTGLTKSRVSDFVNGKHDALGATLRKMFLALGIEVKPADKKVKR